MRKKKNNKEEGLSQKIVGKERVGPVRAGEKEIVVASERAQTQNITTMMMHGNVTRQMVKELGIIVDALQNKIIMQNTEIGELRKQLALLQQQFYSKGTVSHGN